MSYALFPTPRKVRFGKEVLDLIGQLCGRQGFEPLYHRFQVSGRCGRCRAASPGR